MKLTKDEGNKDFGHKKFAFRIDEKHQMKAIWALINLYEHKVRTPVQEILSNARDAHREVGKPDHTFKVEVSDTQFIVRDYGSGISPDKAQNIFCSIGESTKTGDNNQTGGFGIGAKSPLAYTKQFEVISYVDGTKYHYMIAKNGESLDMNLIAEENTNIVNGTKVIIPIKKNVDRWGSYNHDKDQFVQAVRRCCYFWKNRPEFNHKIEPLDVFRLKSDSSIGYYKSNDFHRNMVVVDGIPYESRGHNNSNLVTFYNTGDIRLHETRERLNDTEEDRSFNQGLIDSDFDKAQDIFQNQDTLLGYIDNADVFGSLKELSNYSIKFRYNKHGMLFQNNDFRFMSGREYFSIYESRSSHRYPYNHRYYKAESNSTTYKTEIFYNDISDKTQKVTRRVKNYLNQYINRKEDHRVLVLNDKLQADLFKAKLLSTLVVPKTVRSGEKKTTGEITVTVLNSYGQSRKYVDLGNVKDKFMYVGFKEIVGSRLRQFCEGKGYKICLLSKDSISNVKGNVNFTDLNEWVSNYSLTCDEKKSIYYSHAISTNRDYSDVDDKNLMELKTLSDRYEYKSIRYSVPKSFFDDEINSELTKIETQNARIRVLESYELQEYPLLNRKKEANTEYINALHAYRKNLHALR